MSDPFARLQIWLEAGGNRTIEVTYPKTKNGREYRFIALVGGQPYTSAGGTLDECVSYLEAKIFLDIEGDA